MKRSNLKIALCIATAVMMLAIISCASKQAEEAPVAAAEEVKVEKPVVVVEKKADDSGEVVLDEKVTGETCNSLYQICPVTITAKMDTSYTGDNPVNGAKTKVVEYLGKKALRVTSNYNNEIRIAYVFEKPVPATQFTQLRFCVAGVDGGGGVFNCGLLYTEAAGSGSRVGSFYVGDCSSSEFIETIADLNNEEQWGKNFVEGKEIYCVQFWTNQTKKFYINDVELLK